ncbi:hypothetical protein [Roseococcus pinisoli]|uniref:Uncharacterized protein n=1 Tax=Roseococcus pinisoli TaxID=2835040 RepID=A0ABS5QH98_9PROT|nr:hypothetical protein [Roseococcus pinisoli]MBS7812863.1 hypothetical protein [Roseococcus pinisoli]
MPRHTDELIGKATALLTCPGGRKRLTIMACKGNFHVWSSALVPSDTKSDKLPDPLQLYEGSTITLPAAPAYVVQGGKESNHLRYRWG